MDKILINIDSRHRNSETYDNSNFFRINYDIVFKNVMYAKVSSFEVFNLFYTFNESRFNTSFQIKNTLDINFTTITINNGNYSILEMKNALNNALMNAGFVNVEFTYNLSTRIFTLSRIAGVDSWTIYWPNGQEYYRSLGYHLGYRTDTIIIDNTNTSQEADTMVDLIGENYFFLRVNDWGNIYVGHNNVKRVLAKIIMDANKKDFVFDNNSNFINKTCKFRQPVNVDRMEIELLDFNGNRLENGNFDWSMTLELGQIYDERLYQQSLNYLDIDENMIHAKLLEIYPPEALEHKFIDVEPANSFEIIQPMNDTINFDIVKEKMTELDINEEIDNVTATDIEVKRKLSKVSRKKKKKHYKIKY